MIPAVGAAAAAGATYLVPRVVGNYVAINAPQWAQGNAYNAVAEYGKSFFGETLGGYIAAPIAGLVGLEVGAAFAGGPAGVLAGVAAQAAGAVAAPLAIAGAQKAYDYGYDYLYPAQETTTPPENIQQVPAAPVA